MLSHLVAIAGPLLDDTKPPVPYLATAREVTFFVAASIAHPIQAPEVLFHSLLMASGVGGRQKEECVTARTARLTRYHREFSVGSRHCSPTRPCQTTQACWP